MVNTLTYIDHNLHICINIHSGHHLGLGLRNDYYNWIKRYASVNEKSTIRVQIILLYALLGIKCNIHSVRAKVASIQFETFTLSNNLPNNNLPIRDIYMRKQNKTSSGYLFIASSRGIFSTVGQR